MFHAQRGLCALEDCRPLSRFPIIVSELCLLLLMSAPMIAIAGTSTVNEVKIGALAHDVATSSQREHGVDINGEVLFQPLAMLDPNDDRRWLVRLLSPRPVVGVSVNNAGYTDQLYFGVDWHVDLWKPHTGSSDTPYIEFTAGGAAHDGRLDDTDRHYSALGSRILFHLSMEAGVDFADHYSLGLYFEHDSNGGLDKFNRSLNNAGLRLGYRL